MMDITTMKALMTKSNKTMKRGTRQALMTKSSKIMKRGTRQDNLQKQQKLKSCLHFFTGDTHKK